MLHNGEINTIRGNLDRMLAREETMHSPLLDDDMDKVLPVVDPSGSDSAMLDNTLEFLLYSGMDLPKAVMLTIPEPWSQDRNMPRATRDMYHYYATMMEPWDGPAAILFSDGDVVGAVLDRNGLRPIRYYLTDDGTADPGLRGGRAGPAPGADRPQIPPRPGQDAPAGHPHRPGPGGRGHQVRLRRRPSLRRVAGPVAGEPAGPAHPQPKGPPQQPGPAR